jgi:hypothetical protein
MGIIKQLKKPLGEFADVTRQAGTDIGAIGPYQGPWVAPIDPRQTEALGGLETLARSRMANNPAGLVKDAALRYLDPNYLNLNTDQVFLNAIQAASNPVNEARADELNRARSMAAGSGAELGERAYGIQEGNINTNVNRVLSDMTSKAALEELGRREGIQTQVAPEMLAGALGLEETPARLLGEIGTTQRQLVEETEVDPAKMSFEEQIQEILRRQAPYQNLFGTTGVPQKPGAASTGGGGGMGILQGVLGLAGGLL